MAYYTWRSYKLKLKGFQIFEAFSGQRNSFFLDSSLTSNGSGRYSFIGANPFYILKSSAKPPFKELRFLFDKYRICTGKRFPPFLGGAVGFLSYDLGFVLESKFSKRASDGLDIPDCFFAFYNNIIVIDNIKKELHVFLTGFPEKNYTSAKSLCKSNLRKIHNLLSGAGRSKGIKTGPLEPSKLDSNFTREKFILAVKKAKRYIKEGDIYQVNLSQKFRARTKEQGLEIYRRLRNLSPSSFSAYFDAGDFQILSSSPERFLKQEGDYVVTSPMKGTRPRSRDKKEDECFKKELMESLKDKAELTMIVDLERNDLGRVCRYDSIKVNALRQLEKYNTVFQTTATISGRLHKDKDRFDLLQACFPGGSITGCPKIRSMQIIEELEPDRRNIYTGSLGYLSFSGNMDFNILIRTILKKRNDLYFGVGSGIVADSDPEAEYEETLVKARAMAAAINARI